MIKECVHDPVLQEDIECIARDNVLAAMLQNKAVLVTGATGLIGSQIVKTLACFNRLQNTNIKIYAMIRNLQKAEKIFGELLKREDVSLIVGDIEKPVEMEENINYIIHGASATSSKYFVSNPVETVQIAINGTKNILELARSKKIEGMVYMSSLEVYGTVDSEAGFISENYYGYINPLNVRSSYSESKRMVECLCASYASEYQVPVKIARLSQTFGAGVEYSDGRVFAEFARCVMEKKDIILHTPGRTIRTYCYTKDAVSALLYVLLKGNVGEAYNVTNMNTAISIREMAEMVALMYSDSEIKVRIDLGADEKVFGYNPEMIIKLNADKLMGLGWKSTVDLETMYRRMIDSIRIRKAES